MVSTFRFILVAPKRPRADSEQSYLRAKQLRVKPALREPHYSLVEENRHLFGSHTMLHLTSLLSYLQPDDPNRANEVRPWSLIYPQSKDGLPALSPTGLYTVRLFWMGAWRKITVDDALPFDESGACLIIQSPIDRELWPSIILSLIHI